LQASVHDQILAWAEATRAARHLLNSIIAYRKAVDLLPNAQERRVLQTEIDEMELQFKDLTNQIVTAAKQAIVLTGILSASSEKR
jgi:adenine/guanine phosphoribosyltransferase-like PRPP-binding protein